MQSPGLHIPGNVTPARPQGEGPIGAPGQGFRVEPSSGRPDQSVPDVDKSVDKSGDALFGPWRRLEAVKHKIADLLAADTRRAQSPEVPPYYLQGEVSPTNSPAEATDLVEGLRETNFQLLQLQMETQSCTLEIELLSKVTEQSTSSTKQVLQTQA